MVMRDAGYERRRKKSLAQTIKLIACGGLIGAFIGISIGLLLFDQFSIEAVKNTVALTLLGTAVAQRHNPKIYLIPSMIIGVLGAMLGLALSGLLFNDASDSFNTLAAVISIFMTMIGAVVGNVIIEFLFDMKIIR